MSEQQEPRWYCFAKDGRATLCIDKEDAEHWKEYLDKSFPQWAPHRAVQLIDAAEVDALESPWIAVSDQLPAEGDGEVLACMGDGSFEIAWATYWHGASNTFAQWSFRDPDEDRTPVRWMRIPK